MIREYDEIRNHLTSLSSEGEILLQSVSLKKNKTRDSAVEEVRSVETLANRLREQSEKLFLTRPARKKAVQAELLLGEARHDIDEGRYRAAREQAKRARTFLEPAEREINATLNRYLERKNVIRWRRWVRETLDWSRRNAAPVIVVRKAERTLTLYQGERPIKVYPINLGFNGLNDKRSVGDGATPEGAYRVILKKDLGETKYHRALLINYPNERDRTRIKRAKRLGGLIEIHGGRNEGLEETLGCVALDNDQMDDLFSRVPNGTPVTIVGTTNDLTSTDFAL
ncbi:MAG: L,D-transpeptidase [Candidatus Manganitrophus sp.]|nr:MAG: L,D-transpeptidase [Candidatus Manganitrophus sp.]